MPPSKIIRAFKIYQKASKSKRQEYLDGFEEKMIYRTTKTENPETTLGMVRKVLHKLESP